MKDWIKTLKAFLLGIRNQLDRKEITVEEALGFITEIERLEKVMEEAEELINCYSKISEYKDRYYIKQLQQAIAEFKEKK